MNEAFTKLGHETRTLGTTYHQNQGEGSSCRNETAAVAGKWSQDAEFEALGA